MGRRVKLTEEQQEEIRRSGKYHKDLAEEYKVSALTISRIKRRLGGYSFRVPDLGVPVLNANGEVIGVQQPQETGSA
jgi:hypothetical protein